ncbi:hypothetical protein BDV12DRAFT_208302 [Aspergillus spectabilis]
MINAAPDKPYPGQLEDPEPPVLIRDNTDPEAYEEWEIKEIVDCRINRGHYQYRAMFDGPWDDWNTNPPWQPWTDFKNAPEKILEYHYQYPHKPPPPDFFTMNS